MLSIALVAEGIDALQPSLSEVASALQIQLTRDAGPAWSTTATCTPFSSRSDVPSGFALLLVVPDTQGDGGFHTAPTGEGLPPSAQVDYTTDGSWTISASHEAIEMLVDPSGGRFHSGPHPTAPATTVQFLIEACDPCQDPSFAYQVDDQHGRPRLGFLSTGVLWHRLVADLRSRFETASPHLCGSPGADTFHGSTTATSGSSCPRSQGPRRSAPSIRMTY